MFLLVHFVVLFNVVYGEMTLGFLFIEIVVAYVHFLISTRVSRTGSRLVLRTPIDIL